jgi:hypothetical protein
MLTAASLSARQYGCQQAAAERSCDRQWLGNEMAR